MRAYWFGITLEKILRRGFERIASITTFLDIKWMYKMRLVLKSQSLISLISAFNFFMPSVYRNRHSVYLPLPLHFANNYYGTLAVISCASFLLCMIRCKIEKATTSS